MNLMTPPSPFQQPDVPEVLPRGPHGLDREVVLASQRGRLLVAFIDAAAERGYNNVTIADIVRGAGTAKRTFYDHFEDKQDCFVQAFVEGSSFLISDIVRAGDAADDPIERIEIVVRTYLQGLIAQPNFTRLFLNSPISAGPEVTQQWIQWVELLADGLVAWRKESRTQHPEVPELTRAQAVAAISAINELARIQMHHHGIEGIAEGVDEAVQLAKAFLTVDVSAF